jgi:hypothetical protein
MTEKRIREVFIDSEGKLRVYPHDCSYDFIYRSVCGVHWNSEGHFLYSPAPQEMSYPDWFSQIICAVDSEYGDILRLSVDTTWGDLRGLKKEDFELAQKQAEQVRPANPRNAGG